MNAHRFDEMTIKAAILQVERDYAIRLLQGVIRHCARFGHLSAEDAYLKTVVTGIREIKKGNES